MSSRPGVCRVQRLVADAVSADALSLTDRRIEQRPCQDQQHHHHQDDGDERNAALVAVQFDELLHDY